MNHRIRHQSGMSLTEYLVVLTGIMAAFLVPFVDDQTAVEVLIEAVKQMYANFSFGISLSRLPTPS